MISIHQDGGIGADGPRSIGFSLMTLFDDDTIATTGEGLYLNSNYGTEFINYASPFKDNELAVNHIDCNPREWNEFWVQIVKDSSLTATHSVKIWMNGDIESPYEFLATASERAWRRMPHMCMGFIGSKFSGAVDIDYYGVQLGLIDPIAPCEGVCFDNAICLGDTLSVFFTYDISANSKLVWNFEGASFVDTTDLKNPQVSWDKTGYKTISSLVQEDGITTDSQIDSVFVNNIIPTAIIETDTQEPCGLDPLLISYAGTGTQLASYHWNFDSGEIISGTESGPYEILWSTTGLKTISLAVSEQGCSSDTSIILEVHTQPPPISICMVGVDSSNHNMVVWEQSADNPYELVKIYKQTSQADVYEEVGVRSPKDISVYIDSLSNPAQNSDRYKIAVTDTSGCESPLSDYHKTLHLTISTAIGGAWNLIWEQYKGLEYSTYNIYRGTSSNKLLKIAERASNTFSYTDLNPPIGTVYYMMEIEFQNSCNINGNKSSNSYFSSTRSNIVNTANITSTQELSKVNYRIYPNPFSNYTTIQFHNPAGEKYQLSVVDLSGKVVYFQDYILTERIEFSRNGLLPGIYIFDLTGPKIIRGKIIIQ